MPLGISFYTFHSISYVVDVYRREVTANARFSQVALYISFFPQLIAGPILRYKDINKQIESRKESIPLLNEGVRIFIYGLSKKLILANFCGKMADYIFGLSPANLHCSTAWLGALAYTFQIFFDFSGYSSMAIGLGKMFGFQIKENFNYPYISQSIQEFWRRWHISLSTWFKDYLYIPLGGNRKGTFRTVTNHLIVFGLCGFWHGAGWSFIVWGFYHGALLSIEKINIIKSVRAKTPKAFALMFTMVLVMVGWVFFRSENLPRAMKYLSAMFGVHSGGIIYPLTLFEGMTVALGIIFCIPWHEYFKADPDGRLYKTFSYISLSVLFLIDVILMIVSTYNPFIYFRF